MTIKDKTAIVGVGATPYYKRGKSQPQTMEELVGKATLAALADAGLKATDVDGFAFFGGGFDTPTLVETLGIPEIRFTAMLTGTGGGSAGALGLAASAIITGVAKTIVVVGGMQQILHRYGVSTSDYPPTPYNTFFSAAGLVGPGHLFALLARRHMHLYGTKREHFAEVALSNRAMAQNNPEAVMFGKPMTMADYFNAPLLADPHCLFDFCLENDGAVAVVITSSERARDLAQKPAYIMSSTHGGERSWGRAMYWQGMSDEFYASSGQQSVARHLYEVAGIGPQDVDCAQIYDHFTSQVLMQLEDFGFCGKGESGAFVESGAIRMGGKLPLNTDGGQTSCGYMWGMTHIREAVLQIRGTSTNQVPGAKIVLATGGPTAIPVSAALLRGE